VFFFFFKNDQEPQTETDLNNRGILHCVSETI